MARRSKGGWYESEPRRIRFEHGARQAYPGLRGYRDERGGVHRIVYALAVEVPEYEPRRVEISFADTQVIGEPRISADGPGESPHRYRGGFLCIYEPTDDPDQRWVPKDGLLALIRTVQLHLFREAWWREHHQWLGEEVVHWGCDEAKEAA